VIVHQVTQGDAQYGYDALKGEFVDMFSAGIVDPRIVVESALVNAVSVAGTVLTTGAVITDLPEEKSSGGMPDMGGMGMM
jgi:chaperonin GroEL